MQRWLTHVAKFHFPELKCTQEVHFSSKARKENASKRSNRIHDQFNSLRKEKNFESIFIDTYFELFPQIRYTLKLF